MKLATNQLVKNACHHCGDDCETELVQRNGHHFCCSGCALVFDLLTENELDQFYIFNEAPVRSLKGNKTISYSWLDQPDIHEKLIDFSNEQQSKIRFYLPQIHCSACIWLLEKLYRIHPAIQQSRVNFLKKEIDLSYDPRAIKLSELVQLLHSLGYAPEINLSDLDHPKRRASDKRLIYQLGLAGFVFGNTMLLSFPEYLGLDSFTESRFRHFFGYLNLFLALPVLFYSAQDYLRSAFVALQHQSLNIDIPISLGILTLFARSAFEIITQTDAGYLDSLSGLVFFLLIGKWYQQRTYQQLSFERDYSSFFPITARLKNGPSVPINKLKKGDLLLLHNEELIPADGILQKGTAHIDYSFVTGEALPVSKKAGDKLYAGGRHQGPQIEIKLTKAVSQSYLTQLWSKDTFQKKKQNDPGLSQQTGKYFTVAVLIIAFITLLYWLPRDMAIAINAFTAVLIIACPCAIALSIPFTFGNTLRLLSKHGFFLKDTQVVESLKKITTIVFDKTGTLSVAKKAVKVQFTGTPLLDHEKRMIKTLALQSNHPLSRIVCEQFHSVTPFQTPTDYQEIQGKGIQGNVNQGFIKLGSASFIGAGEDKAATVHLQIDGRVRGYFTIFHKYRPGINQLINKLSQKYDLHLLSGDTDREQSFFEGLFSKSALHFNKSPQDKLDFVRALQRKGKKVLMIGDGLNDAGALKESYAGIVITEDTNNFTPASDVILKAEALSQLPRFLRLARASNRLIWFAYGLAIVYNIAGLSFAVQGLLSPVIAAILMPLSSITIVAFGVAGSTLMCRIICRQSS